MFVFIISIIIGRHLSSPYYHYHVLFKFFCDCLHLNQLLRHHLSLPLDVTGKSVHTRILYYDILKSLKLKE